VRGSWSGGYSGREVPGTATGQLPAGKTGIVSSNGNTGGSYDNALAERIIGIDL